MNRLGRLRQHRPAAGLRLWLRDELASSWARGLPVEGESLPSPGRGRLLSAPSALGPALVRDYRRGGLLRGLLPDVFLSIGRALSEVRALERLEPLGLSPAVLGLEARGRGLVRLRVAIARWPGARDLLSLATADRRCLDEPALGAAIGRAVRAMHEAGVSHADLNVANLLVGPAGGVRLIDFDGARLHEGPVPEGQRREQVLRLCRSLDKWASTVKTPARVRAAFLREVLSAPDRRQVLRSARARHPWRRAVGRTGRASRV